MFGFGGQTFLSPLPYGMSLSVKRVILKGKRVYFLLSVPPKSPLNRLPTFEPSSVTVPLTLLLSVALSK